MAVPTWSLEFLHMGIQPIYSPLTCSIVTVKLILLFKHQDLNAPEATPPRVFGKAQVATATLTRSDSGESSAAWLRNSQAQWSLYGTNRIFAIDVKCSNNLSHSELLLQPKASAKPAAAAKPATPANPTSTATATPQVQTRSLSTRSHFLLH